MNFNVIGQTIVAAQNPDIILQPAPGPWDIENTGCDIRDGYAIGDQRGVMVYDGSSPYFQWFDPMATTIKTSLPFGIVDPDIVISADGSQALIVYELNSDIFIDIYEWSGASFTFSFGQQIGDGSNPNIDISFGDYFSITWVNSQGDIKSVVGNYIYPTYTFSGISTITNNEEDRTPDVAIYELNGNIKIKYTYISVDKKANTEVLKVKQADYSDVFTNNVTTSPTTLKTINLSYESFGRPRIATPPFIYVSPHNINDYMIVIDYTYNDGQSPEWKILGFNRYINNLTSNIVLNPNITSYPNTEPVVTYAGDFIVISWTSDIYQNGALANEVVSRMLYNYGSLMNNTISIVNNFINEYQYTPSISGRFSEGEHNLHLYVNEGWGNMEYKVTSAASTVLRTNVHTNNTISVASNDQNAIELKINSQNYSLSLYNSIGQLIITKESISGNYKLPTTNLPIGVYIIKIKTENNSIETLKFIKN